MYLFSDPEIEVVLEDREVEKDVDHTVEIGGGPDRETENVVRDREIVGRDPEAEDRDPGTEKELGVEVETEIVKETKRANRDLLAKKKKHLLNKVFLPKQTILLKKMKVMTVDLFLIQVKLTRYCKYIKFFVLFYI